MKEDTSSNTEREEKLFEHLNSLFVILIVVPLVSAVMIEPSRL